MVPEWRGGFDGCLHAVTGRANQYDSAAVQRQAEEREAVMREARERARRMQASERRARPFGDYTWVFGADVLLGALLGAGAMLVRHRDAAARTRRWWGVAGAVLGFLGGGAIFLPFFVFAQFLTFLSPLSANALFGLTVVGLVVAAGGLAFPRRWARWPQA
ncbi:MAG TPA: hypothetical protein VMM18_15945 [Gemmatimonadaceae bacterium]|nr:hypothetical protein [Gemmatimonadaceae bacterium]